MIGTSPPKQNPPESVTLRAKMVAAAASAALPPCLRISMPAATDSAPPALTAPWRPVPSEPGSESSARTIDTEREYVTRNATTLRVRFRMILLASNGFENSGWHAMRYSEGRGEFEMPVLSNNTAPRPSKYLWDVPPIPRL